MATNINTVTLTGNLTKDPETREAGSSTVTRLRVAVNNRRKGPDGWEDKPGYYDVTVWGAHGENCARYLKRGSGIAVSGRLDWREWEADGVKRQAVDVVAETVQFLNAQGDAETSAPPVAIAETHNADSSIPF